MMRLRVAMSAISGLVMMAAQAEACSEKAPLVLEDIGSASIVVVGRISNYKLVLDQEVRRKRREERATSPERSPEMETSTAGRRHFLTDYAQFDIVVQEVLAGRPQRRLTVTWEAATMGEPTAMASGPFLIALRTADSEIPPVRAPIALILGAPDPNLLTVFQPACAPAFIFPVHGKNAIQARKILVSRRN